MTSHELAKQLLELPNLEVWLNIETDEGRGDSTFDFEVEHRQPVWYYTGREDTNRPNVIVLVEKPFSI
jgi:hypothetical protein